MVIREADAADIPALLELVVESAEAQGARDAVCVDADDLSRELFGPAARAHALVADEGGRLVGVALYFFTFSTWTSVNGVHLEDLYVQPEFQRRGIARALMRALARIAATRKCGRLHWHVLTSNTAGIAFYKSIGAQMVDDWRLMQLDRSLIQP
jgi:GNAT superfamily N-acetyltransferase